MAERVSDADTFLRIEQIARGSDPLEAARKLHQAGKQLYWKEKNLPAGVALLRASAQLALTADEGRFRKDATI